ncbi:MAG: hemerythrin family protein [Calditrichaeota bacterium]|nr:hemerythrin family protein [Calditrichota bacterium]MCB0267219.1 hemerythrin family protein [Calditrichota bacterium]MCB0286904.1 hemerythrin family protein [Calditrichota bacterium]MCB0300814.1 hemerythrin family protein [Calditrichota bacterium]MCB9067619.1 hemerythrin family protein [Calditrichia bacterium]
MSGSLRIAWDDSLSSGNRAVDIQHKYLIDIINELADVIEQKKGRQAVKKVINLLKYYTVWHFEREEKCMEKFNCPTAKANKGAHAKFIETFLQFESDYRNGASDDLAMRMYKELTDWLVSHIKKIDGGLASCVHTDSSH